MLESLDELVMAQLTAMDQLMLLSPQDRWSQAELPSVLKSQVIKAKVGAKVGKAKSKWGARLAGTWGKSRSKQWQNVHQLSNGEARPVPHASKRKADQVEAETVDANTPQNKQVAKNALERNSKAFCASGPRWFHFSIGCASTPCWLDCIAGQPVDWQVSPDSLRLLVIKSHAQNL